MVWYSDPKICVIYKYCAPSKCNLLYHDKFFRLDPGEGVWGGVVVSE